MQFVDEAEDREAGRGVEVARRLVGHEDRRIRDERPRDRHTLLLPAAQLARSMPGAVAEADPVEHGQGAIPAVGARDPLIEERDLDVLRDRELGDQVERLEDESDPPAADAAERAVLEIRDLLAVEPVVAARRAIEAAEDVHERGLPGARRTHDRHVLAAIDPQIDALERLDEHRAVRADVGLADSDQLGGGWRGVRHRRWTGRGSALPRGPAAGSGDPGPSFGRSGVADR